MFEKNVNCDYSKKTTCYFQNQLNRFYIVIVLKSKLHFKISSIIFTLYVTLDHKTSQK